MNKRKKTIILGLIASVVIVLSILTLLIIKNNSKESKSIRIIGTSDLHGKMLPFDYTSYTEDESGSVAQLATAIREFYDENTYLVDVGDSTQGNMADLFVDSDVHPMIMALNKLKYDLWVIGNHEFDYKPEILGNFINDFKGTVLTGNLYRSDGTKVCDGYKIIEKNGIRVAFIGMTTPNDSGWSKENKDAFDVTDSLEETRKIINQIKGKYDVLVGLYHMDIYNEFDIPNSGVEDICNACPEFDVMVASHGHRKIEGDMINGKSVAEIAHEYEGYGFSMPQVHLIEQPIILYGEYYGGKIQGSKIGGRYGKNNFRVFDVLKHGHWMSVTEVEELCAELGIDTVPNLGQKTIREAEMEVIAGFKSKISEDPDFDAEGMVLRAPCGLCDRWGNRIIVKIKTKDYQQYDRVRSQFTDEEFREFDDWYHNDPEVTALRAANL